MHHGSELPEELKGIMLKQFVEDIDPELRKKLDDVEQKIKDAGYHLPFGATGRFPDGQIGQQDEGEIQFGVAHDRKTKKIFINFGKPIQWMGCNSEQARYLAKTLWDHANKAEGINVPEPLETTE